MLRANYLGAAKTGTTTDITTTDITAANVTAFALKVYVYVKIIFVIVCQIVTYVNIGVAKGVAVPGVAVFVFPAFVIGIEGVKGVKICLCPTFAVTYQKILAEAMEELGVETGMTSKNQNDSYVSDCTIETDQLALIPDSYIDVTAEKIRIYKELDSLSSDKDMDKMKIRLEDRFGKLPDELQRLFDIVRIRQLGVKLGFEKIIIKNGVMIAFFISNPLSQYYRSDRFSHILENVTTNPKLFELKQNDNKLRVFVRNVDGIAKAFSILKKLQ